MVKFVVLPVLIVLLALHAQTNALGVVRVDVQQDNNAEFANAFGNAISSKIQSIGNILSSLIQIKFGGVTSADTTSSTTTNAPSTTESVKIASSASTTNAPSTRSATSAATTRSASSIPIYRKVININSGYAPTAPVRSNSVGSYPVKRIVYNKSFYPLQVVYTPLIASKTVRYSYGK